MILRSISLFPLQTGNDVGRMMSLVMFEAAIHLADEKKDTAGDVEGGSRGMKSLSEDFCGRTPDFSTLPYAQNLLQALEDQAILT